MKRVEGDSGQKAISSSNHITEEGDFRGRSPILTVLSRNHCKHSLSEAKANPYQAIAAYNKRATVVALVTSCRARGSRPRDRRVRKT